MISNKTNKKAIMITEALMRLMIAIVLLFIVFKIGKQVVYALFGGSNSIQSFEKLVEEMNSIKGYENPKEILLSMDKETAVVGFSKNSEEFQCKGCKDTSFGIYFIKKPYNEECKNEPCICLCRGLTLGNDPDRMDETKFECKQFFCKKLKYDIAPKISFKETLDKKKVITLNYPSSHSPYWENGFFFMRLGSTYLKKSNPFSDRITELIGDEGTKIVVTIQEEFVNGKYYVGACPIRPCIIT